MGGTNPSNRVHVTERVQYVAVASKRTRRHGVARRHGDVSAPNVHRCLLRANQTSQRVRYSVVCYSVHAGRPGKIQQRMRDSEEIRRLTPNTGHRAVQHGVFQVTPAKNVEQEKEQVQMFGNAFFGRIFAPQKANEQPHGGSVSPCRVVSEMVQAR